MNKFFTIVCLNLALLVVFGNSTQAQTVSTTSLKWLANEFFNKEVKETITHASVFETTTQKIKWIQKNGARVYEFDVKEIDGNWQDTSKDGELTYRVSFRGNKGTIKFSRRQGRTTIETNIPLDGKNILPYTFTVTSISTL